MGAAADPLLKATRGALLGLSVADAIGVPYEFLTRQQIRQAPCVGVRGFGTHNQPAGTWSDDSSLTFCLADSLAARGYDLAHAAAKMVQWYHAEAWTPHGKVFDIGIGTAKALRRVHEGVPPTESGLSGEMDNGNGALMRILPLLFHIRHLPIGERWTTCAEMAGITHRHVRSVLGCFIYLEYARLLLDGHDRHAALKEMAHTVNAFLDTLPNFPAEERGIYHRLLLQDPFGQPAKPVHECPETEIRGSGYVVHCLEASLWCFLRHDSYEAAVLEAVNLGEDTDTTACVAGGLAGLYWGEEGIPSEWLGALVQREEIEDLAAGLAARYQK